MPAPKTPALTTDCVVVDAASPKFSKKKESRTVKVALMSL